jgi:hypothetical protein
MTPVATLIGTGDVGGSAEGCGGDLQGGWQQGMIQLMTVGGLRGGAGGL